MRRLAFLAVMSLCAPWAVAQEVPQVLMKVADPVPGLPGWWVHNFGQLATNGVGGWAAWVQATDGQSFEFHVVGSTGNQPPVLLRSAATVAGYSQLFGVYPGSNRLGIDDRGRICYGPKIAPAGSTNFNWDSLWVDDEFVYNAHVSGGSIGSAGITRVDRPYWVRNNLLMLGRPTQVLCDPHKVPGLGPSLRDMDLDRFAVSPSGFHYIVTSKVSPVFAQPYLIVDGAIPTSAGELITPNQSVPVPAAAGGLPGETWRQFIRMSINDAGRWGATAEVSPGNYVLVCDGLIRLRHGDPIGGRPVQVGSSFDYVVDPKGDLVMRVRYLDAYEAIIRGERAVLGTSDPVDFDGDGIADPHVRLVSLAASLGRWSVGCDGTILFVGGVDTQGTPWTQDDTAVLLRLAPPQP